MLLLAIASVLLFFVTYFNGVLVNKGLNRWMGINSIVNPFETFILGLMGAFVYFNLLSLVIPVNYIVLLPLFLTGIWMFSKQRERQRFFDQVRTTLNAFASPGGWLILLAFMCVFFVYWIIPPANSDSAEYHYTAIRWYEQYKAVPGLGNIHGRLAFNPASFIISAAWSFTGIAGQALYPLNGVLVLLFYLWILKKILTEPHPFVALLLLLTAILLLRLTLVNISSPSSDALAGLLIFYTGWKSYERIKAGRDAWADYFVLLLITLFAFTAKLSALVALLAAPLLYFVVIRKEEKASLPIKAFAAALLLLIPWLIRNVILSGYLLYPIAATGIFHFDWTVPRHVLQIDQILVKYAPVLPMGDMSVLMKMPPARLLATWWQYSYTTNAVFSCIVFITAMIAPLFWALPRRVKQKTAMPVVLLWCIYYGGLWVWLINAPEFRFGMPYMLLCIFIPLIEWAGRLSITPRKWYRIQAAPAVLLTLIICIHYSIVIFRHKSTYHFTLAGCWLLPLRDYRYFHRNDQPSFPFVYPGKGVRLYLPDATHDCLNANGPCMVWPYGTVQMRGNAISDGFRNTQDEVIKYFPYIKAAQ